MTTLIPREEALPMAVEAAYDVPGNILEFGVYQGESTRTIIRSLRRLKRTHTARPLKRVFACDSFEGLPETWETLEVGHFACEPPKIPGATIVKGFYATSLNPELSQRARRVALASLDADLFSSTLCELTWLTPLLGIGSLLFDEYLGDGGAEKRAHEQWQEATGIHTEEVFRPERVPVLETPNERVLFRVTGGGHPAATPLPNSHDL